MAGGPGVAITGGYMTGRLHLEGELEAVTALSFPEMIILRRVLKPRLIAIFLGIMTLSIIGVGYLFNAIV